MKKIFILLLIVMAGGAGGAILYNFSGGRDKPKVREQQAVAAVEKIQLTVEDGTQKSAYEINYREGMTALDATEIAVSQNMVTKGEGKMAYVTSIAGRAVIDDKREFWEFLVNGKQAEVGAGSYVVQKGDIITWRVNSY